MYSVIVARPTCSATWAKIVLIEYVIAVVSVCGPQLLLPSLASGTPETVIGELPLITEFGRVQAAVDRRRGGHDLERRARGVVRLGRAVEERVSVRCCSAVGLLSS